jgi:hypothetical protein
MSKVYKAVTLHHFDIWQYHDQVLDAAPKRIAVEHPMHATPPGVAR